MILVLNCGSQSIKYKIFQYSKSKLSVLDSFSISIKNPKKYKETLFKVLEKIPQKSQIEIISHRVVHGGNYFFEPTQITDNVLQKLDEISPFAPLHNPFNIAAIKICQKIFPMVKNFAFFDTGFFKDLPEVAKTYPLPKNIIKEFNFQRFGFHGLSHEYVAFEASKKLKKSLFKLNLITCHLGGGGSICAIKNGKPIDISMGFTPLEGIMMMTRSGDIDPGIVIALSKKYGANKTEEILNKKSGIVALCGSNSMLDVLKKIENGDETAKLAFDIYVYRIKKYIGAYFAILGSRVDALVFTGQIGAGKSQTRKAICRNLNFLKGVKIFTIPTDEERMIVMKLLETLNVEADKRHKRPLK